MPSVYNITANDEVAKINIKMLVGAVEGIKLDFKGWVDDNESITAVTIETFSGDVSATNQLLADNIATADLNASDSGRSLLKVTATGATKTVIRYIETTVTDLNTPTGNDYGFGC